MDLKSRKLTPRSCRYCVLYHGLQVTDIWWEENQCQLCWMPGPVYVWAPFRIRLSSYQSARFGGKDGGPISHRL